MSARSNRSGLLAALISALVILLVGVLANLVTQTGLDKANTLASVLGLTISVVATLLASFFATQAKREAKRAKEGAEGAQRQADSIDVVAYEAGVDPSALYDRVLQDARIPVEHRFIYAWNRLEGVMRSTSREIRGDDFTGLPLGRLISEFADLYGLKANDKDQLGDLLRMRNSLMHGTGSTAPESEIEAAIAKLARYAALAEN